VAEVLRSGWSGLGSRVDRFEQEFANHLGVKHAIATNSCTAALQLALKLVGVSEGGAVLVPALTFLSTGHVVKYLGATPLFCDVDAGTLCTLEPQFQERLGRRNYGNVEAALAVLYGGQPLPSLQSTRPIVYDCAHACGSTFDARGKLCCWSFHAVKNLSCGEGGMLTTDDTQLAERARRLRWMGISTSTYERNYATQTRPVYKWEYDCQEIGYKANMHDVSAAIGLVQLARLGEMQTKRRQLVEHYIRNLAGVLVQILYHVNGSSHHLMVIRCDDRDALHRYLAERGIGTGVHYKPIHLYPCYGYQPSLPVVEREWLRLLTLPLYPDLTLEQVETICSHIRDFYAGAAHYQTGA
jgi:dTDP-4-amino-4,6-dideoxygalactose transaminase